MRSHCQVQAFVYNDEDNGVGDDSDDEQNSKGEGFGPT